MALFIHKESSSITAGILFQQIKNISRVGLYPLFIAVIAIDEHQKMRRFIRYLRAFMVTGRRSYAPDFIAIDRQSLNIEQSTPYSFVGFTGFSDAQGQPLAHDFIGIKATDTIAIGHRSKVDQVHQSVDLIEHFAL